jgi:hypothetical protein
MVRVLRGDSLFVVLFELGEASFFEIFEERAPNLSDLYDSSSSSASLMKMLA